MDRVLKWLKVNLALTVFALSILSGIGGFLINGTLDYADMWHELHLDTNAINNLHADMKDVDQRLNNQAANAEQRYRDRVRYTDQRAADQAAALDKLDTRIQLLEAQIKWEAARAPMGAVPTGAVSGASKR